MDDLLVIRIDKKNRFIKIFDGNVSTDISYYSDFEICNEEPDSDCEDFNDNARWIAQTILKIMQLEDIDPDAHADWSADYDHDKKTGKYIFNVEFLEKDKL